MKFSMVVPTYWGRNSAEGWREGDLVFDHPTPLDEEGTLGRFLNSTSVLEERDFDLMLVVVPTTPEIASTAVEKVRDIVEKTNPPVVPRLFTAATLAEIAASLGDRKGDFAELLNLDGYAQVRNGCLLAAQLAGADAAVLIDDDEVFELPDFLAKVREGLLQTYDGEPIRALAGFYLNADGDFRLKKSLPPWAARWPKYQIMDSGFEQFIGREPRYKSIPFAFGGNLSLRKDVFTKIPFDTRVTRGEDIDYLLMALMSGVPTILDNTLSIKHLAPPKSHPQWQQFRQDAVRFAYQRTKIKAMEKDLNGRLRRISARDLDPYPGFFLRDDLDQRVVETSNALAEYYRSKGDDKSADEAVRTIEIFKDYSSLGYNPIDVFLEEQARWCELSEHLAGGSFARWLE